MDVYHGMVRDFVRDARRWGFRVACSNARFNLGYAIGGFTHAERK